MISILKGRRSVSISDRLAYYIDLDFQLAALNLPRTISSLSSIQPFCPQGVTLSEVHKTGLGSSAALITSLVSALLLHLGVIPPSELLEDQGKGRQLAHNLAQFIHCLAQGKVGSGFDVSAAVFGSHLYTRFDPGVIAPLMGDEPVRVLCLIALGIFDDLVYSQNLSCQ